MFIIDRFEGRWAVIAAEDGMTFNLPRSVLPRDAGEGDVIILTATVDREATEKKKRGVQNLLADFFDA
ncbi:hypothetical protein MHOCP_03710 [Moorella humiferrea]|uniref:DUF3006 domain-containing protein n=1 Tax=Neomoorella humiferrea TaxID=676965 RepID=A0A2T0AQB7_9FIRM|nr:DUF3006 domain-containing protein [Moorella humiferrea]PRR71246.1 hypothetical protein MOHU_16720 [Moorella humiferrea]